MSKFSISADGRGVSRQYEERFEEATGVIDKYIQSGDVSRPHFEHSVESLANEAISRGAKRGYDEIEFRARELLKARCTNESTMYPAVEKQTKSGKPFFPAQHVYLDLDNEAGATGRWFGLSCPSILFATLDPERDRMWKATELDDDGNVVGGCVAIAVYFDPEQREETRTFMWDKRPVEGASDWDPACYQGVVRTFPSFTAMREARKALIEAVNMIRNDVEDDDHEDEAEAEYLESLDDVEFDGI